MGVLNDVWVFPCFLWLSCFPWGKRELNEHFSKIGKLFYFNPSVKECSCTVVECMQGKLRIPGLSLIYGTMLCLWARHFFLGTWLKNVDWDVKHLKTNNHCPVESTYTLLRNCRCRLAGYSFVERKPPWWVLWQTVKTQMKCCIMHAMNTV